MISRSRTANPHRAQLVPAAPGGTPDRRKPAAVRAGRALIAALLAGVLLLSAAGAARTQVEDAAAGPYDVDGNGVIEAVEVLLALADYLRGEISRDELGEVMRRYLDPEPAGRAPPLDPEPSAAPAPAPGTCCEVRGMWDAPHIQAVVLQEMRAIIRFARATYGLTHSGGITINISHSPNGVLVRYRDAFGHTPEIAPEVCSFQEEEHLFFRPGCRHDRRALATEWFRRALGAGDTDPAWVGLGAAEYFASHYVEEAAPTLDQDRFQRVVYRTHPLELRRDRAGLEQMTMAVAYAVDTHGPFTDWIEFQRRVLAGQDAGAAFGEVFGTSLEEFHHLFEEWSEHRNLIVIAGAFASCAAAWESVGLGEERPLRPDVGFPDFRVPLAQDRDGDGIVCEDEQGRR